MPFFDSSEKRDSILNILLIVSIVLCIVEFLAFPSFIKDYSTILFYPFRSKVAEVNDIFDDYINVIANYSYYKFRNEQLNEHNLILLDKLRELDALKKENEYLKGVTNLKKNDFTLVNSTVIDFDDIKKTKVITISSGTKDNLKVGNAVAYNNYLIGEVIQVMENTSIVSIMGSTKLLLPVRNETNTSRGILASNGDDKFQIEDILPEEKVSKGEYIYTIGSANFPANLTVGKVEEVRLSENKYNQVALLSKLFSPRYLDKVVVFTK